MQNETTSPKVGTGIFYGILFLLAILALALLPYQTKPGPEGQGWWTQPKLMPMLSLWLFALSATYLCFQQLLALRTNKITKPDNRAVTTELIQWIKPIEFFAYYILYIWLLGWVGYFFSSLIFATGLSLRVGLRSPKWIGIALLFALTLTAMFRWVLGVWIPPAELYDLFPKDIRIFLMKNF